MKYAGFWVRVLAKLIDLIIFLPFFIINSYFFKPINKDGTIAISLSISILILLYNVLFIYFKGMTPGKTIMKLRVVKTDCEKAGIKNSIYREAFAIVSLMIWILEQYKIFGDLSYVSIIGFIFTFTSSIEIFVYFFNYRCKTVHDFIGDTVVIKDR